MSKSFVCLFVFITLAFSIRAQDNNSLQESFLEAEYFFMNGDYTDALSYYLQLHDELPDNYNIAYRIGVCYLNIPGVKDMSVEYLESACRNISEEYTEGSVLQSTAPFDALFDLAVAYRVNYMFNEAKDTFLRYSKTLSGDNQEDIDFINHEINICETAEKYISRPVAVTEENIGEPINDEKANFYPLISPDGGSFVYMVSLKFYDAVMFSERADGGKWTPPVNITPEIQFDGDFYISCLCSDGNMLLLSKDDNYNSDIWVSERINDRWTKAVKLSRTINTKHWESHGYISEDGLNLVFASDRPGGYGGLDLYISRKDNGEWSAPVNLGPEINTKYNEDRPFLIDNGNILFFSSQGHENIGGYDLFRSSIQPNGLWSKPQNLGYPLNTPDDNVFFMPVDNGRSGYYSAFKESEGYGDEDIYKISLK